MSVPHGSDSDQRLAALFALDEPSSEAWSRADLEAVLRHQLRAPLQADLTTVLTVPPGAAPESASVTVTELSRRGGDRLQTFADLLSHPNPPLELVRLMKD